MVKRLYNLWSNMIVFQATNSVEVGSIIRSSTIIKAATGYCYTLQFLLQLRLLSSIIILIRIQSQDGLTNVIHSVTFHLSDNLAPQHGSNLRAHMRLIHEFIVHKKYYFNIAAIYTTISAALHDGLGTIPLRFIQR